MTTWVRVMENFRLFTGYADLMNTAEEKDMTLTGENVEQEMDMLKSLDKMHIFEMDNKIKNLLYITKAPKDSSDLKLPFDNTFLEVSIDLKELGFTGNPRLEEIKGILISQRDLIKDGCNLNEISMYCLIKEVDSFTFYKRVFSLESSETDITLENDGLVDEVLGKDMGEMLKSFCINFLNFINNPDIDIETNFRSERNMQLKKKRGKPVFSSTNKIILKGNLKEQLDRMDGLGYEFNHKFWVRGHFCRYHTNKGEIVKWILPYIKGKGVLVENSYKLKKVSLDNSPKDLYSPIN